MYRRLFQTSPISLLLFVTLIASTKAADQVSKPSDQGQMIQQIYQLVDDRNPNSPLFQQALSQADSKLTAFALEGLARIGGKSIIPLVVPFLNHADEALRQRAAFALGLCANKEAAQYLWQRLELENSDRVKHEIYLGLGNLGQNGLISKMMKRLNKEKSPAAQASLFQGLGIALVFHSDLKDDYDDLDFKDLLKRFARGDDQAARVGLFIDRIPKIGKRIEAEDLLPLTKKKMAPLASAYLMRLIKKVSQHDSSENRKFLAWLIDKSEHGTLNEQIEALHGMQHMMKFPQSLVQLGKMQAAKDPIIAQTALKVLADSDNNSRNIISLLKRQLQNGQDAIVVEAMRGLIKRQKKDEMSWVLNMHQHKSAYVKIQLMHLLREKSKTDFNNFIQFLSQDPNPKVSMQAKRLLANAEAPKETRAASPKYEDTQTLIGKTVTLKTSAGNISFKLLPDAPYTAWHFVSNAKLGVFNGSYFSRVIGNFVAQGGDTIGDGEGSSNQTIREEISFLEHEPMTVAMATAGKDTATSQFYINTARNLHLDRNYTIFGKVTAGEEVVNHMTHGTLVYSVEVR